LALTFVKPCLGQRLHPSMIFLAFFFPTQDTPTDGRGVHTLCTPHHGEPKALSP
jgi:hypothetical protein